MAGIYIHIPFCKQRCTYCDFHFSTSFEKYRERMVNSICKEITSRKQELDQHEINTIYFGGGTPSLLNFNEFDKIKKAVYEHYSLAKQIEWIIEANPDDINRSALRQWKLLGINRLSIGLQSFREEDLKWMNRAHSAS